MNAWPDSCVGKRGSVIASGSLGGRGLDYDHDQLKIWNRYLPDYFDEILKQLFRIPPDNFLE